MDTITTAESAAHTARLRKPVRFADETLAALTMDDGNGGAGEWLALDGLEGVAANLAALSIVTGAGAPWVRQLTARDYRAAYAEMLAFLKVADISPAEDETERTLALRRPVTIANVTVTQIHLREPTADQLEQWDRMAGIAKDLKAVQVITGLSEVQARALCVRDFRAAAGWIAAFFEDAPPAGA